MPLSPRPEQMLAAILSLSEDGVLSFTLDGAIKSWSGGAERLYGYAADEIVGQPLARLLSLREIPAHGQLLRRAHLGQFARGETLERVHKDGSKVLVTLERAAIRNERGEVIELIESRRARAWQEEDPPMDGQLGSLLEQMPAVV